MKIHPTAIISPDAQLADDIEVGPYAIIGQEVVIGEGCVIQAHAVIECKTTIGQGNRIGYGVVIGAAPQDFAHSSDIHSTVVIGNNNRIREYVTIHRGTKEGTVTRIGDGCFLMVGCHVGHNCDIGNGVILTNNVLLGGYVHIGEAAVLGGGSVFHQYVCIGRRAMVAGDSSFNKDIPPFTIASGRNNTYGLNVVGLRRAGFGKEVCYELRRAYREVFFGNLPYRAAVQEALKAEWGPEAREFFDFILASKRGCCPAANTKRGTVVPSEAEAD